MSTDVYKQLDFLTQEVAGIIERQGMGDIDPRDFGRLEAEVKSLQTQMTALDQKVEQLVQLASQGRGGIRALWFAGSIVAGIIGWLGADKVLK